MNKENRINQETGQRVLVVDDEASIRAVLKALLMKQGYSVQEAADGFQAIERFQQSGADLVLMDVSMPGMGGHEACRALRSLPGASSVPLIMITGRSDAENVDLAYRSGATDFITKPIEPALFKNRLRYVMRSDQAARRLRAVHARNSALMESLPDTILLVDNHGKLVEAFRADSGNEGSTRTTPGLLSDAIPANVVPQMLDLCRATQGALLERPTAVTAE